MQIIFDAKVMTWHGALYCVKFRRCKNNISELINASKNLQEMQYINYLEFHNLISYIGVKITELIGKNLGYIFTDSENKICENCLVGKVQRKNILKVSIHIRSTIISERLYIDRSSIKKLRKKKIKINTKRFWFVSVDEVTGYKFSMFLISKSSLAYETTQQLNKEKLAGHKTKFIQMDNAGENKSLEKSLNSPNNNLNIEIEYTTRKIP